MNTWTKILTAILIVFTLSVSAKDKLIPFSQLPTKAQTFVKTHFSEKDVVATTVDTDNVFQKEYTVTLNNGTKIEFNGDGEWEEVQSKSTAIPVKITPQGILQHVHKSFPNTYVKEIKRSRNKYEVEISNGLELEFNKKGEFLRIDD